MTDLVVTCPKVNYKLNYKPGMVVCPRTKKSLPYDSVKDKMDYYGNLSHDEITQLPYIQLDNTVGPEPTNFERYIEQITPELKRFPLFHDLSGFVEL